MKQVTYNIYVYNMNSIITFKNAYFQNVYSQKEYLLLVKNIKFLFYVDFWNGSIR